MGRNLNLPEATGNGPGLDWGGAIPFKAEADTLGHRRIEPARLEANSPAGHKQVPAVMYSSGKPGCCRLSLASRQMDCINAHPSSQARVNETMEPWTKSLAREDPLGSKALGATLLVSAMSSMRRLSHPLDPTAPTDIVLTTPDLILGTALAQVSFGQLSQAASLWLSHEPQ